MTYKTWPEALDHFEIRFPFRVELRAKVSERYDDHELRCTLFVPDVNTGEPTTVHQIDFPPPVDKVDTTAYLRNVILRTLAHEVDECIYVDGKRVLDPHMSDPSRSPYASR